jgi:fatty acid/phospholipid biosynthesis enzyme
MDKLKKYPIIGQLLRRKSKSAVASLVSANSVSGGLIWGIDGVVVKMHGHSKAAQVATALEHARMAVEGDVVNCLKTELAKIQEHINL